MPENLQHWQVEKQETQTNFTAASSGAKIRANKNGFWFDQRMIMNSDERAELVTLFEQALSQIGDYRKASDNRTKVKAVVPPGAIEPPPDKK